MMKKIILGWNISWLSCITVIMDIFFIWIFGCSFEYRNIFLFACSLFCFRIWSFWSIPSVFAALHAEFEVIYSSSRWWVCRSCEQGFSQWRVLFPQQCCSVCSISLTRYCDVFTLSQWTFMLLDHTFTAVCHSASSRFLQSHTCRRGDRQVRQLSGSGVRCYASSLPPNSPAHTHSLIPTSLPPPANRSHHPPLSPAQPVL